MFLEQLGETYNCQRCDEDIFVSPRGMSSPSSRENGIPLLTRGQSLSHAESGNGFCSASRISNIPNPGRNRPVLYPATLSQPSQIGLFSTFQWL